ncbi:MAG: DUF4288 domain-containing protein, partial [Cyanobacteria bacterium J06632_3]
KQEEISYQNENHETITISLKLLLDVRPIEAADGDFAFRGEVCEIYSRYFRDYMAYEAFEPLLKGKLL